jgi:protein O-GlcNAc transferase
MVWSLADLLGEGELIHVLDVGAAYAGEPPYQSLLDQGKARISAFEPNAEEREKLKAIYGESHRFYPHFVGAGGPATFHKTNWGYTGSLYAPNAPLLGKFQQLLELMDPQGSEPVATVRLDDLDEIVSVDYLKIDVQGAEQLVLQNASRILQDALLVEVEVEFVPLYRDQPLFADVDTLLRLPVFSFTPLPRSVAGLSSPWLPLLESTVLFVNSYGQMRSILPIG